MVILFQADNTNFNIQYVYFISGYNIEEVKYYQDIFSISYNFTTIVPRSHFVSLVNIIYYIRFIKHAIYISYSNVKYANFDYSIRYYSRPHQ